MKPLAILTTHAQLAVDELLNEGHVKRYFRTTQRGEFEDGTEFLIVTREEQLEGQEISGFRILGPGKVDQRRIDLAVARVR